MEAPVQPSSASSFHDERSHPPAEDASSATRSAGKRFSRKERACARSMSCSGEKLKSISDSAASSSSATPRQAEDALGDDVPEDLRRSRLDRFAAAAELLVSP